LGVWKLKVTRRDVEKGGCPLFNEEENVSLYLVNNIEFYCPSFPTAEQRESVGNDGQ